MAAQKCEISLRVSFLFFYFNARRKKFPDFIQTPMKCQKFHCFAAKAAAYFETIATVIVSMLSSRVKLSCFFRENSHCISILCLCNKTLFLVLRGQKTVL